MYSREIKTYVHTKTCLSMFIAALFVIAPKWKQYKCLSADEQIEFFKMLYSYNVMLFGNKKE